MARQLKKPAKPEEPDLLPAMGLFTILIPMLLSMTAFSKLAIVEVNLPERSMMQMDNDTPPEPDQQALNLSRWFPAQRLFQGNVDVPLQVRCQTDYSLCGRCEVNS